MSIWNHTQTSIGKEGNFTIQSEVLEEISLPISTPLSDTVCVIPHKCSKVQLPRTYNERRRFAPSSGDNRWRDTEQLRAALENEGKYRSHLCRQRRKEADGRIIIAITRPSRNRHSISSTNKEEKRVFGEYDEDKNSLWALEVVPTSNRHPFYRR